MSERLLPSVPSSDLRVDDGVPLSEDSLPSMATFESGSDQWRGESDDEEPAVFEDFGVEGAFERAFEDLGDEVDEDGQFIVNDAAWTGRGRASPQKGSNVCVMEGGVHDSKANDASGCNGGSSGHEGGEKSQRGMPRSYATERWKAPPLFRPVRIPHDHPQDPDAVSLKELIAGNYTEVLVASYLVSGQFLLDKIPRLKTVPLLIVQGLAESKPTLKNLRLYMEQRNKQAVVYTPKTIHVGLHHSKMILLKCPTGVRVIIMTCNIRNDCWGGRCQAAWYQDFPLKAADAAGTGSGDGPKGGKGVRGEGKGKKRGVSAIASAEEDIEDEDEEEEDYDGDGAEDDDVVVTSEFEETLIDYFDHVGGPAATFGRSLVAYDFSAASVVLVPSVPGRHFGKKLYRYGHMRVRAVLEKETVHVRPGNHRVLFQVASINNLSRRPYKWLGEMTESFMAQKTKPGQVAEAEVPSSSPESENSDGDKDAMGNRRRKNAFGQPRPMDPFKSKYERYLEKRARKEDLRRRNVPGILPPKKPKPPKRLGKKALKRKRREEREAAEQEARTVYSGKAGKERKKEWYSKFLRVLWPSEESIRLSNLGWESGMGMPCLTTSLFEGGYRKCDVNFHLNRVMVEMEPLLATWTGAQGMNRDDAMPHLNTYCRYRELKRSDGSSKMSKDGLAYFLLGSHGLHRMSWGYLELIKPSQGSKPRESQAKPKQPPKPDVLKPYVEEEVQLNIKSFDMGILFLPSRIPPSPERACPSQAHGNCSEDESSSRDGGTAPAAEAVAAAEEKRPFSCDPDGVLYRLRPLSYRVPDVAPTPRLRTLPLGLLPIPYQLPPKPYEYTKTFGYRVVDRPWCWNRDHQLPDKFGIVAKVHKKKRIKSR